MIHLIDTAIADRVTTCFSAWLERWGGLVIPVQRKVQVGETWTTRMMPVSCTVDPACEDDSKYQKVLPDSAYKSVGYLIQVGSAQTSFSGPRENLLTARYRLRFVVWLNYQKLGLDDCNHAGVFELETIANLKAKIQIISDELSQYGELTLSDFAILPKDPAQIFSPFYMFEKPNIYTWPYGFFAVEFTAKAVINTACLTASGIPNETECLTNW